MSNELKLLVDNLHFSEGPRWHDGKFWYSDFYQKAVFCVDESGSVEKVVDIPNQPSGLGWLPNNDLLIVSMHDQKLMKYSNGQLTVHSDLSHLTQFTCNDMVVDRDGHAYIGNFGTTQHNVNVKPTCLIHVTPDGDANIAADNLEFPNGTVITPDGKRMILGETYAGRLTSYDINDDKSLSNRKVWAQLMPLPFYYYTKIQRFFGVKAKESTYKVRVPDGICLDEKMGIWVASPTSTEVLRVEEGGKITDSIQTPNRAFACMLGGQDRKTLYISTGQESTPEVASKNKFGKIYTTRVDIPGAGWPA
jgi:sugar lactone lactonase YvrE